MSNNNIFVYKQTADLLKEVAEVTVTPTKTNTLLAKRNKSKKKMLTKKVSKEPSGKVAEHTLRKNSRKFIFLKFIVEIIL